jgi:ribosomal protein S11
LSLRLSWNENEHIVVECLGEGKENVVASLVIEETGDAVNKIIHITANSSDKGRVRLES